MDAVTATPASGIDSSYTDDAVRAQDDLYAHFNGKWLATHEIPADRSIDGSFIVLRDRAEENVRDLIVAAAASHTESGTDECKIGDLYASFMDTSHIEALGIGPISDELAAIDAVTTTADLARRLGRLQRHGVSGLIGFYVDTDAKDSSRYLVHLSQSGLGLPDESYYREDKYAAIREDYRNHIEAMLRLAGLDNPADSASTILDLETAIAAHHWDVVARRDAERTYNLLSYGDFAALAGSFNVEQWIAGLGSTHDPVFAEVVVRQPEFVSGAGDLIASRPLDEWKTWLRWQLLHSAASYLPTAFVDEDFAFYGRTLSGAPELRERWKRGVAFVEEAMGFAVGRSYVAQYFPAAAKARMDELIANLVEAYRRNISDLEWMTPATRAKALAKLESFNPKIGYPAHWRDYSALLVDRGDLIGNVARAAAFENNREFAKIGAPVDRDEWFMTPQTVNAYYNPGMNEIVFPAAILQPPFFDADADDAVNYGGIGAVIGHEIGHGFDDQGAKYDGEGNLIDWWTDEDRSEFAARTRALIDQYNEFTPTGLDAANKVNGEFTIGENIGDLGGLSIAVVAYRLAHPDPPVIDGMTGDQRLFYSWAQIWRSKVRDAEAIKRLAVDPHSPPEFRCNGVVRNIDAFYDAFDVQPGDKLYLEPAQRVRIW
ncbi:MAG TPA: M13-type metalloendopeptidase [Gordonia sp. (in: high G+C Gram-positive bacteria)]|uniref:M13 family metallopeptidase n=1 Tax=unclassified Gordonia (in: high G+C Gram-positive bacteria) TaxID=2657482 RepID=UPI000FA46989|nr:MULTISPECIES: M13-type metalloendopeptidase [unclassified Gordonia (in: high G+C Gram-positive bacteria)]RUP38984.1 MAG: peptidase M13 [Gordonia sp. (in: high G+C Gram-positive bacteria)]HNP56401.1 M13-type metalloendopeptidase [Gordonia sp. (in: high G+C Gram-positive bacteria)]HRC51257.1 M13-type metalloendopeptidase [Gordonia sp. (in: high G+C Gram-positive bacteria)]